MLRFDQDDKFEVSKHGFYNNSTNLELNKMQYNIKVDYIKIIWF